MTEGSQALPPWHARRRLHASRAPFAGREILSWLVCLGEPAAFFLSLTSDCSGTSSMPHPSVP